MSVELQQSGEIEGDAAVSPRPSRSAKITSALEAIEADGTVAECISATPGAFLWEFYKAWVDNGGQDGGKNRNSIRRMRDVWLVGDHEVKSLHPKLTGKVRISRDDAKSLMSLFLGRWKFVGVKEGDWVLTADGYAPFPCQDCKALCNRLADAMYPEGSDQLRSGLLLPERAGHDQLLAAGKEWDELAGLYKNVDALITLSRHNSAIGPTPTETIRLFWHYMNFLYETTGDNETVFIWIVDIGRRQIEDDNSWRDFYNFEMLKTQFRAFASFDSENDIDDTANPAGHQLAEQRSGIHDAFLRSITIPEEGHREKRWKWLCERTVIVIQNLRKEEFEHLYAEEDQRVGKIRTRDIGVTPENILPNMIPSRWSQLRELRELYGNDLKEISDATLTVLVNRPGSDTSGKSSPIRYFAHALTPDVRDDTPLKSASRSSELTSPGEQYDQAMSLVYWAARHRLKKVRGGKTGGNPDDWAIATAYLGIRGFRVIRLPEFMRIHRSPGD
ncbi:MAG: hypothetical protein HC871_10685 [Rhizobiales bacterium]|nr:hypothetical protein [Hyphomicrobiales bacterium]